MNWTKLTLLSGVALAVIAVPAATAQRNASQRSEGRGGGPSMRQSPAMGGGARSFQGRSGNFRGAENRGNFRGDGNRGNWRGGGNRGNWRGGDGNRWGNHRHGHHRHHRHYRPRFYGYYGGFGYPYGYGFGSSYYGYPYYGASMSLYYNGYNSGRVYEGRSAGGSLISQVQQELANAGYYQGAIDGVIGNGTRSAIRRYERENGLRVDGRIDDRLLSSMGLS